MPVLSREEYIEQAHFFRVFSQRLEDNQPSQEILDEIRQEILATTRLPLAIEVLKGELLHSGRISPGMQALSHYFTPFQTFIMSQAEEDRTRFDQRLALVILEREARYRSEAVNSAGLFIYQFECLARNRLGYEMGMTAMAADPQYNEEWREFLRRLRIRLGEREFCDHLYYRSEWFVEERRREQPGYQPSVPMLFGPSEGRIAKANRGKDPLYLFSALQRQLNYPAVPRAAPGSQAFKLPHAVELRIQRLEKRLQILEGEAQGKLDLSPFLAKPPQFTDEGLA